MPATVHRLFFALLPDAAALDALASWQAAFEWPPRATPMSRTKLHATLHFLGDVDTGRVAGLTATLAIAFEPFDLAFARPAVWPNGAAVLEPVERSRELMALHARLGIALEAARYPVDSRPYRPHVTLARHAKGAVAIRCPASVGWRPEGFALVESRAGEYQVLAASR